MLLFLFSLGQQGTLIQLDQEVSFIAASPADSQAALVTPDGQLMIFTPGKAPVPVADSVTQWGVCFSPDGKSLAFLRDGRVTVSTLDGHITWQSEEFEDPGYPVWVDSKGVAYTGDGQLFLPGRTLPGVDAATISINPLTGLVAFCDIQGKSVFTIDPATGERLSVFSDPDSLVLFGPRWSPDGRLMIVCRAGPGFWVGDPALGWKLVSPGEAPSWSPDGTRLVYQVSFDDGHRILSAEILLYDLATGVTEKVAGVSDRLSPVFGKGVIYYVTLDGQAGCLGVER